MQTTWDTEENELRKSSLPPRCARYMLHWATRRAGIDGVPGERSAPTTRSQSNSLDRLGLGWLGGGRDGRFLHGIGSMPSYLGKKPLTLRETHVQIFVT